MDLAAIGGVNAARMALPSKEVAKGKNRRLPDPNNHYPGALLATKGENSAVHKMRYRPFGRHKL
jgi:hypothetical protein